MNLFDLLIGKDPVLLSAPRPSSNMVNANIDLSICLKNEEEETLVTHTVRAISVTHAFLSVRVIWYF